MPVGRRAALLSLAPLVVAAALRLGCAWSWRQAPLAQDSAQQTLYERSLLLLDRHVLADGLMGARRRLSRDALYVSFVAALEAPGSPSLARAYAAQALLSVLAVAFVLLLGDRLRSLAVGSLAAAAVALDPAQVEAVLRLDGGCFAAALLLAACACAAAAASSRGIRRLSLAAAAALCAAPALAWPPPVVLLRPFLWLALVALWPGRPGRRERLDWPGWVLPAALAPALLAYGFFVALVVAAPAPPSQEPVFARPSDRRVLACWRETIIATDGRWPEALAVTNYLVYLAQQHEIEGLDYLERRTYPAQGAPDVGRANDHVKAARLLLLFGKAAQARGELRRALLMDPGNPRALRLLSALGSGRRP